MVNRDKYKAADNPATDPENDCDPPRQRPLSIEYECKKAIKHNLQISNMGEEFIPYTRAEHTGLRLALRMKEATSNLQDINLDCPSGSLNSRGLSVH